MSEQKGDTYRVRAPQPTTSRIDRTSRVWPHQQDADISWLFLYRYGAKHTGWSICRIHSEP